PFQTARQSLTDLIRHQPATLSCAAETQACIHPAWRGAGRRGNGENSACGQSATHAHRVRNLRPLPPLPRPYAGSTTSRLAKTSTARLRRTVEPRAGPELTYRSE